MGSALNGASNLEIVTRGYELLDRDETEEFLDICDQDAEWVYPADNRLPYGGTWHGRDGVAAFLEAHDQAEEILELRVDEMFAGDEVVATLGLYRGIARSTGAPWETRFVHIIRLRERKWAHFEAYFDTAAALAAHDG